jgi:ubiquitin-conjugating enzyme E2 O
MVGTVVNVSETCTLEPIARIGIGGALDFGRLECRTGDPSASAIAEKLPWKETSGRATASDDPCNDLPDPILPSRRSHFPESQDVSHPRRDGLLYDIPSEELKRAADFEEGDYVLRKDWIGIVDDSDLEVVLLLENNTVVVVKDPEELELVIPDFGKPLVTLPDLDGIRRPDVLAVNAGGMMSIPYHNLQRGQFVITNHRNIREGRWLVGAYHENCQPQGHILDIRALRLEVQWLCPNPFALETPAMVHSPFPNVRPYENLSTFNIPSELRRNKSLVLYDRLRLPANSHDGSPVFPGHGTMHTARVMFKDGAGAAVKYQGGERHGQYQRIPKESAFGFDLNEFRVMSCRQEVQVQWQDQHITCEQSIALIPYTSPEAELCPGDIVTLKQGTRQAAVGHSDDTAIEFNEMLYFQGNFRLWPEKVGVIQSVDSKERLARLRLFADPHVELLEQGNVLRAGSRLGNVSDVVEEVSLYEVMSHPALLRRRGDLVVLPPERPPPDVIQQLRSKAGSGLLGPSAVSYLRRIHPASKFEHLRNIAKHYIQSDGLLQPANPSGPASQNVYDASRPLDWIGEIMDLGPDGLTTVRLGALGSECRDIKVPFERILMVVDGDVELDDGSSQMSDAEPWLEYQSGSDEDNDDTALLEEVEYEGGERLDDDSDSVWMTDDEPQRDDVVMEDSPAAEGLDGARDAGSTNLPPGAEISAFTGNPSRQEAPHPSLSLNDLARLRPLSGNAPLPFAILASEPPPDQFAVKKTPPASSAAFLRRVGREHRILSTSLPVEEIYVRTYESRLDLLRCLIIGPAGTPYEYAPFVVDLQLGPEFPQAPPVAHFHSWTGGLGRINPNLYEEGRICLSLLNTWPGQSEGESWSDKASILQVLMSLMGLVLVDKPFYNEAGFESYSEDKLYMRESQQYSEKVYAMARGFVKHALSSPVQGLEDVLAYLYLPPIHSANDKESDNTNSDHRNLLGIVVERGEALIERSAVLRDAPDDSILVNGKGELGDSTKAFLRPLSRGAVVMLKKTLGSLRALLEMINRIDRSI